MPLVQLLDPEGAAMLIGGGFHGVLTNLGDGRFVLT
jgi:hypothetical protein